MQLKVPFSEIPEHGIEFEIRESSWFPEDQIEQAGPVSAHIRLIKKDENKIELKGNLQVDVTLVCDRCLKRYVYHLDSPMQLLVEVVEKGEHWRMHDMETSEVDLETISQEKPVVDLAELLQQQLFLVLPDKRLCIQTCAGLCPQCGSDLNEGNCTCTKPVSNSPFAVLGSLKKK